MKNILCIILSFIFLSGCSEKPLESENVFGIPLGSPISEVENINNYKTLMNSEIQGIPTSNLAYTDEENKKTIEIKTLDDIVHSSVIYRVVTQQELTKLTNDMIKDFGEPEKDSRNGPNVNNNQSFALTFQPRNGTLHQVEFTAEYLGEHEGEMYFKTNQSGKTKKLHDIQVKIFKEAIEALNKK